jgi:hypothetical protein
MGAAAVQRALCLEGAGELEAADAPVGAGLLRFSSYTSTLYFSLMGVMASSMPPPHLLVKRMAFA